MLKSYDVNFCGSIVIKDLVMRVFISRQKIIMIKYFPIKQNQKRQLPRPNDDDYYDDHNHDYDDDYYDDDYDDHDQ